MSIAPYYDHAGITIYHADCREILPTLPKVDALITDPPYGINYRPDYGNRKIPHGSTTFRSRAPAVIGDAEEFDPGFLFGCADELILWGANHYAHRLPHRGQWLVWDKRCQIVPQRCQSDCEIAWKSSIAPDRIFYHLWDGMLKASERGISRVHPTQKPIALMQWCIGLLANADTILDPFMGSGTTLLAAKRRGCKAVGIEIEERYCEVAAKRLSQEIFDFQGAK